MYADSSGVIDSMSHPLSHPVRPWKFTIESASSCDGVATSKTLAEKRAAVDVVE
jgi:hypothetical protein